MRVVIFGATGNVGTSIIRLLTDDPDIDAITGVARRIPEAAEPRVEWRSADISETDLRPILDGADAVIHLAWAIQPSHHQETLWRTNVVGSRRVLNAVSEVASVNALLYASSVGAYSPGSMDDRVDEDWPVDGMPTSFYSRHKSVVEWLMADFQVAHPEIRVVCFRPSLIFKRSAATGIRRLFLGPLFPGRLAAPGFLPMIPNVERLRFQAMHTDDVATAFHAALTRKVRGPFNLTAEPVLTFDDIAELLQTRSFSVPLGAFLAAADVTWRLRLQPTPSGWLDMAAAAPKMSPARARSELSWEPTHTATHALSELIAGLASGADFPTPALSHATGGMLRRREFTTAAYPKSG